MNQTVNMVRANVSHIDIVNIKTCLALHVFYPYINIIFMTKNGRAAPLKHARKRPKMKRFDCFSKVDIARPAIMSETFIS